MAPPFSCSAGGCLGWSREEARGGIGCLRGVHLQLRERKDRAGAGTGAGSSPRPWTSLSPSSTLWPPPCGAACSGWATRASRPSERPRRRGRRGPGRRLPPGHPAPGDAARRRQAAPPPPAVTEEEIRALAPDLRSLGAHDLQDLEDKLPSLRSWAFVKLVGEESARAASVDAGRALELASFTLWVAERVSGDEGWVSRVFAWAILANARRVGGDLAGAEEAFACSARLQADPPEGPARASRALAPSRPRSLSADRSAAVAGGPAAAGPRRKSWRPGRVRSGHVSCVFGRSLWTGWETWKDRSRRCARRWPRSTPKPSRTCSVCSNSTSPTA